MDRNNLLKGYLNLINYEVRDAQSLEDLMINYSSLREKVKRHINYVYLEANKKGNTDSFGVNLIRKELIPLNKHLGEKIANKILSNDYIRDVSIYFHKFILDLRDEQQEQDDNYGHNIRRNKYKYLSTLEEIRYTFNDTETSLKILEDYLYSQTRKVRHSAWEAINFERNKYIHILEDIFFELVSNRNNLAKTKGYRNYKEYAFSSLEKPCILRNKILEFSLSQIVPLKRIVENKLCKSLKYDSLRPWDVKAHRKVLESYDIYDRQFIHFVGEVLRNFDNDIYSFYRSMIDQKLYDIGSRKDKVNVNYCTTIGEEDANPYIYLNLSNSPRDMISLVHEFGHAYHYHQSSGNKLLHYNNIQLEIAEIASLTMEALFIENLTNDSSESLFKLRKFYYTDVLYTITGSSMLEEFEQYVYTFGADNFTAKFNTLMKKYNGVLNMSSYYKEMQHQWRFSKQLFLAPFYTMEYGISQIIALLILINYKRKPKVTLKNFKQALAFGSSININVFLDKMDIQINDKNLSILYKLLETELKQ